MKIGDLWLRRELKRLMGRSVFDVSDNQMVHYIDQKLGEFDHWVKNTRLAKDERGYLSFAGNNFGGIYNYSFDWVIAGGGGAGGNNAAPSGGAGGGGVYAGTALVVQPRTAYAVTIGARGNPTGSRGGAGGDTFLGPYGVAGGAGGGGAGGDAGERAGGGAPSAIGGGGGAPDGYGGTGTHGFAGRTSASGAAGGGGGGATQHGGGNGTGGQMGMGGNGYTSGIFTTGSYVFGPGGGGGNGGGGEFGPDGGNGGLGGRGGGTTSQLGGPLVIGQPATSGSVYGSGGGGGGASVVGGEPNPAAAPGIQGVVVLRYLGIPRGLGGSISQASGYTIHTFTANDTFYT